MNSFSTPHVLRRDELFNAITLYRTEAGAGLRTNFFNDDISGESFVVYQTKSLLVFFVPDIGFQHVYFLGTKSEELLHILMSFKDNPLVLDYITKKPDSCFLATLNQAGFKVLDIFERLTTIAPFACNVTATMFAGRQTPILFAEERECNGLYSHLLATFDPRTSHLPSLDVLCEWVRCRQVLVTRDNEGIVGYLVYNGRGRRYHLNYWYNNEVRAPLAGVIMMRQFYTIAPEMDIRVVYAWVSLNNRSVCRAHRKLFGLRPDGLQDYIFIRV